jgi:tetratricopeptide (TPR) repeat protein
MYILQYCLLGKSEDSSVWITKASKLIGEAQYEEAIACLDEAIRLNPENSLAWHGKGASLELLKRHEEAIVCFDEAIRLNPEDSDAWHGKGVGLGKLKRYEEAIACFDEAIRLNPEDSDAWHGKGLALESMGRDKEAEQCFGKVKKENSIDELLKIPVELRSNDQFKKIAEICYSAYQVDPTNIFAMREMMTCSLHLWMSDNAIFWADKILEIDEYDFHALGTKASALSDKGMHGKDKTSTQKSMNIYKKMLEIDEKNITVMMALCTNYQDMKKYDEAMKLCDKALKIDENWENTFKKGTILMQMKKYDEAMKWIDTSLKYQEMPTTMGTKGMLFYFLEEYTEAMKWCDKALKIQPDSVSLQGSKKLILEKLNQV